MKDRLKQWIRSGFRPEAVAGWEWFLMRLLFAAVIFLPDLSFLSERLEIPDSVPVNLLKDERGFQLDSQPAENGIARLFDLTWLNQANAEGENWMPNLFRAIAAVLLLIYVAGRLYWIVLPLLVILLTLPHTLMNSQGYIFHGYQMVTMTLVAQAIVSVYVQIQKWRGKRPFPERWGEFDFASWMFYYTKGLIAAAYVTSSVTKLINSKGLWIFNSRFFALDLVKAQRQEYYRTLDPEFSGPVPMADWLIAHPLIATALFDGGFFIELFAIVALHSRKWALAVGISIIAFHRSVQWMMNLSFPFNEAVILIFLINLPFWIGVIWTKKWSEGTLASEVR